MCVCVCVCVRERERERESACVLCSVGVYGGWGTKRWGGPSSSIDMGQLIMPYRTLALAVTAAG